jgi:hypothetical protein
LPFAATRGDADIAFGVPELAGPTPHPPEHPFVQVRQEAFVEHLALACERPLLGFKDIRLFRLIQFAAQGDVGRD